MRRFAFRKSGAADTERTGRGGAAYDSGEKTRLKGRETKAKSAESKLCAPCYDKGENYELLRCNRNISFLITLA